MINKKIIRILKFGIYAFFIFSLLAISFSLLARVVRAQAVSLSISPPITEIMIQPGKTFNQTFTIKNDGPPVVVVPKIIPFVPSDSQGHVELIEDQEAVDAFVPWFNYDLTPVALGTNVGRDFTIKITPPESAAERDYYFTFLAEVKNDNNIGISSTQSQARIGANILMTVSRNGDPQKSASIVKFSAPKIIDSFTGITYKLLIGNSGATFFKPTGEIKVEQIMGSSTVLNLAPLNILVNGKRELNCIKDEDIITCSLPGKFLIGIYRANLNFTLDKTGSSFEKQSYTIAFPFSITLGLILIGISYYLIRKMSK